MSFNGEKDANLKMNTYRTGRCTKKAGEPDEVFLLFLLKLINLQFSLIN